LNIIFDWSGTLADDQKLTWNATNQTLEHFGVRPVTFDVYQKEFTIPVSGFYHKYCPTVSIKEIDTCFFQNYRAIVPHIKLFNGLSDYLPYAARHNALFILSTLDREILVALLKRLNLTPYFTGVYGNASPKSEVLISLIKKHNLIKNESIYIGDMPHDIEAARNSGIPSGAVTYGYTGEDGFRDMRPDHIFNNLQDIKNHLDKMKQTETFKWPLVTAGGLVFNNTGQALIVKTHKWSGLFGTPGGKVDYGETLEETFKREIHEETNITVKDVRFVFYQDCIEHPEFYKPAHFLLMNYIARYESGEVILNYESEEFIWATLTEMKRLNLNEPTINLVNELLNRKDEFSAWIQ